jgi:hypothetical protein
MLIINDTVQVIDFSQPRRNIRARFDYGQLLNNFKGLARAGGRSQIQLEGDSFAVVCPKQRLQQ